MLKSITIEGFKSIKSEKIELGNINILIGANGSGKSNFMSAFRFLREATSGNLQVYVGKQGGAENILYFGLKTTLELHFNLSFEGNDYEVRFFSTANSSLILNGETIISNGAGFYPPDMPGRLESGIPLMRLQFPNNSDWHGVTKEVVENLTSWRDYHFQDTSDNASIKQLNDIHDNVYLRSDASNLAAFLYLIRETRYDYYNRIVKTIRLAAPFFDDFYLRSNPLANGKIRLEWTEKGPDKLFGPESLSDGTLRFMCLTTLLQQPPDMLPPTILIDEPELGLHPYAITLLAGMLQSVSEEHQVIVSTQSVSLVNQFQPEDLIVVNKCESESKFKRLDRSELEAWMKDYSLGELWEKNVLGGRPSK
jgi:predicted ATPase